jgi:cardiolipin synthase
MAWAGGIAATLGWRYASDSLRHRREHGDDGYTLHGDALDVRDERFMATAEALTGAPISTGDDVELLINGDEIFPAFLETIAQAERTINLLTYVYWRGEIATEVGEALCRRAQEGIEVNVLLDAIGTAKMERGVIKRMRECGVRVARFRPLKPYAIRRANNRTHRKILVADGRVGMIGGVGIAEEWTGNAEDPEHWRDTHVRIRGPVVRGLQGAFADNWLEATGEVLTGDAYLPDLERVDCGGPMMIVRSSAGVGDTDIEALYFLALASARERIDLTAAYFAPRPAFIAALTEAAERGVEVRVLVPGPHIDKGFVRIAGRGTYDELLGAGVRVFEYQPTMLHAKTLTIDGAWSSVGSVNFDNRSFQLHDEATLCVQSERFAGRLTEQFERDLEASDEMRAGRFARRPKTQRAQERVLQLARREL